MALKETMLANFQKIKRLNLYWDLVSYFVPVFIVFMFGFYARNPLILDTFAASRLFGAWLGIVIMLIVFTALGKVIADAMSYVLLFLQYCFYTLGRRFAHKGGIRGVLGRLLESLTLLASDKEVPETALYAFFKENDVLHSWYNRLLASEIAFRTGVGSLFAGFLLFEGMRGIMLGLAIILLLLAWSARQKLAHAELEIESHIRKGR